MTNEEAIEVLNNWDMACPICEKRKSEEKGVCADCRFNNALNFAIKALEERSQAECVEKYEKILQIVEHWNDKSSSFVSACEAFEKILDVTKGGAE